MQMMVENAKSWLRENSTLVYFLVAQAVAMGGGAAALIAYSVKLETRVNTMEVRGAAYTVARMDEMRNRIIALEEQTRTNKASIDKMIDVMTRELRK
jgi:hypothetical protein